LQYHVAEPRALSPVNLTFGWGRTLLTERASFGWRGFGRGANDGCSTAKSAIGASALGSLWRFWTTPGAVLAPGPKSIGVKSAGEPAGQAGTPVTTLASGRPVRG
jgi:hypothetical protein